MEAVAADSSRMEAVAADSSRTAAKNPDPAVAVTGMEVETSRGAQPR